MECLYAVIKILFLTGRVIIIIIITIIIVENRIGGLSLCSIFRTGPRSWPDPNEGFLKTNEFLLSEEDRTRATNLIRRQCWGQHSELELTPTPESCFHIPSRLGFSFSLTFFSSLTLSPLSRTFRTSTREFTRWKWVAVGNGNRGNRGGGDGGGAFY